MVLADTLYEIALGMDERYMVKYTLPLVADGRTRGGQRRTPIPLVRTTRIPVSVPTASAVPSAGATTRRVAHAPSSKCIPYCARIHSTERKIVVPQTALVIVLARAPLTESRV